MLGFGIKQTSQTNLSWNSLVPAVCGFVLQGVVTVRFGPIGLKWDEVLFPLLQQQTPFMGVISNLAQMNEIKFVWWYPEKCFRSGINQGRGLVVQVAINLQETCNYCSELPVLEPGWAPAVQ